MAKRDEKGTTHWIATAVKGKAKRKNSPLYLTVGIGLLEHMVNKETWNEKLEK